MEVCHLWFSFLKFGESFYVVYFFRVGKWGLYFFLVLAILWVLLSWAPVVSSGKFSWIIPLTSLFYYFSHFRTLSFFWRETEDKKFLNWFSAVLYVLSYFYFNLTLISRHSFQLECYHICYCLWVLSFNGALVGTNSWTGQKLRLILFFVCRIISYIRFKTFLAILYSNITFALFSSSKFTYVKIFHCVAHVSYCFLYFPFFFKNIYPSFCIVFHLCFQFTNPIFCCV